MRGSAASERQEKGREAGQGGGEEEKKTRGGKTETKHSHFAGEDAAEREEPALVLGGDHLGHVEHQRAVGVARADGLGVDVVERALVQSLDAVDLKILKIEVFRDFFDDEEIKSFCSLSLSLVRFSLFQKTHLRRRGRREVVDHHLEERLVRREPGLHDPVFFLKVRFERGADRRGEGEFFFPSLLRRAFLLNLETGRRKERREDGKKKRLTSSSAACRPARGRRP